MKQKRKGSGGRKKQPEIFLRNILKDTEKKLECEIQINLKEIFLLTFYAYCVFTA